MLSLCLSIHVIDHAMGPISIGLALIAMWFMMTTVPGVSCHGSTHRGGSWVESVGAGSQKGCTLYNNTST